MGFKPPVQLESKRGADGNRWEFIQQNGQVHTRVVVATTGEPLIVNLSQSDLVATLTGPERTALRSILNKLQDRALTIAGWIDDTNPDPTIIGGGGNNV